MAFEWQSVKAPLIEVRGYAALFEEKRIKINAELIMKELYKFIRQESEWFFDLRANQNKEKEE